MGGGPFNTNSGRRVGTPAGGLHPRLRLHIRIWTLFTPAGQWPHRHFASIMRENVTQMTGPATN